MGSVHRQAAALRSDAEPESVETFEVPAAVLCAACGSASCDGRCREPEEPASGVIAIVPWERPGPRWGRLWATARATTQGVDSFFAALPAGPARPALRFALLAEGLAVGSLVCLWAAALALAFPTLAIDIATNTAQRGEAVLRAIAWGMPAVVAWMVAVHVVQGAALELGARRAGATVQRRRALRFGLYACGWDLMTSPLGAVVTLASQGWRAALALPGMAVRVPGRATTALLRGCYGLDPPGVARARRVGAWAALFVVTVSSLAAAAAVAAWLF